MATDQVDNYFEVYAALYQRLSSLVDADHCHAPVPACPGCRVHDVIAHLAGLCEDWVNHRLDGYASPAWTANQVKRHAHRPCAKIFDVWAEAIRSFALLDETFLGRSPARWAFGDAVIHEADVRGTLAAGRVPDDAVLMGLKGTIARWRETLGKSVHRPFISARPMRGIGGWVSSGIPMRSRSRLPCTRCSAPWPGDELQTRCGTGTGPVTPSRS